MIRLKKLHKVIKVVTKIGEEAGNKGLHIEVDGYNHTFIITPFEAKVLRFAVDEVQHKGGKSNFHVRDIGYYLSLDFGNYGGDIVLNGTILKYSQCHKNLGEKGYHMNIYKQIWLGDTAEAEGYDYTTVTFEEVKADSLI